MTADEQAHHVARAADARRTLNKRAEGRDTDHASICGYEKPDGKLCKRAAGWGTEHKGVGPCKSHDKGWAAMRGDTRVERYARPLLAKLTGYDVDVNPMDALLMCVRITAAEVAYFSERIGQLTEEELVQRPIVTRSTIKEKDGTVEKSILKVENSEELSLWMRARKESMIDLARFSKMAMDAGVEERLVRVAESVGESLALAVRGILEELGLSVEQRANAPEIVRKHLRLIGTGSASA